MKKKSRIKLVKEVFTSENTSQFLFELDLGLKTINYIEVEKLILRYGIQDDPECKIFLQNIKSLFEDWKIEDCGSVFVDDVKTRITKCFACFLGKSVVAYKFCYQHKGLIGYDSRIIYAREFAIFTDIKNNCLVDFGVCNAFLSHEEMSEL